MILHFSLQWSHRNFCSTFLSWARTQNTGLAYFQYCTHFVWCCVCVCVLFFFFCSCGSSQRPSCHVQFSFIETLLSTDPNNPMHIRIVFPMLKTHMLQVSPLRCMLSGKLHQAHGMKLHTTRVNSHITLGHCWSYDFNCPGRPTPCCALKTKPVGVNTRQSTEQESSGAHL